jgi:hypothetical protein
MPTVAGLLRTRGHGITDIGLITALIALFNCLTLTASRLCL